VKRFYLFLITLALVGSALLPLACSYPPSYPPNFGGPPTNTPTPTSTIPPLVLSVSSFKYSTGGTSGAALSAPVTISVGQAVVWDASNSGAHTLYIDNMASICNLNNNTSFPVTYSFTTAGNYLAHCGIHGACSVNSACPAANCTGMAATIHVQ